MRLLLLSLLLVPLLTNAQTPLGTRVGSSLSAEEKTYFGLFPGIEDFASVRTEIVGDSAQFVVSRSSAPDTTYVLRPGQIEALRTLIETFEQYESVLTNPNWQVASGTRASALMDPGVAVPHVPVSRSQVSIRSGDDVLSGIILRADDRQLVLHPTGDPYAWQDPQAVTVPSSEIAWVDLQPAGAERLSRVSPLIGGVLGLAAAGTDVFLLDGGVRSVPLFALATGVGAVAADRLLPRPLPRGTYADRQPILSERAAFRQLAPVDFPAAPSASAQALNPRPARPAGTTGRFLGWRNRYGWLNVAAIGGFSSTADAAGVVIERVRIQGSLQETTPSFLSGTSSPVAGIDVAVRPLPWVRLGATWLRLQEARPSTDRADSGTLTGPQVAYTEPGQRRSYAELVLPSPRAGGFGLEVAVGAGRSDLTTSITRESTVAGSDLRYSKAFTSSHTFLQATVELVAPRRTSFFVRWTSLPAPDGFSVAGEQRASSQFPHIIVYERDPHEVTFSGYQDIVWGTRFRL